MSECLGCDTDRGLGLYFKTQRHDLFLNLGCRTPYMRKSANGWDNKTINTSNNGH